MYNVDPNTLIQLIKTGNNPQQLMMTILENQAKANNPLFSNLLTLAKENKTSEIEKIVRNMYAEKGLDYDKEFNSFKAKLGLLNNKK